MKIRKIILALSLVVSMAVGFAIGNNLPTETTPTEIPKEYANLEIYGTSEMDTETLTKRNGKIIIEEVIGEVVTEKGDGEILNYKDADYRYISYSGVEGAKKGDIILTYLIYNPENNIEDDIVLRYDYIANN